MLTRPLAPSDWEAWTPLWAGYLAFYREELPAETTGSTFERLWSGTDGLFGLLALENDVAVGMAHCVVHATTWGREPRTYLQDLFVSPAARGGQVGHVLLAAVKEAATARGAPDVYWHTQQFNGRARSLYDLVGRLTSFVVYEM
jgi:GNAT superfamily N-acetyltransferase